ncbi:MAG: SDR family NAD(P)-dependent oxidoreductase [Candidatus Rokubacteria bacterium]|nr:SDR family NAD(P)-dependent oxidoreductase [Candidatus Rokubacteria bacterium]
MDSFAGRVGVVTGGASGIGKALVLGLVREGAKVVVADLDEPAMAGVVAEVRNLGGEAIAVRTDVSDRKHVEALAERAVATFGAVHVLCNNAGVGVWGPLESATHQDWEWVLAVNLWGVIHGLEAFLPRMIAARQGGHVLNTASMAGLVATQGLGVYNTSKYAVVGLSETLAKDLRPYGIGVSVLCPMGVATRIRSSERNRPAHLRNPTERRAEPVELMGRTLEPEAVAAMALAAIRENRLYVVTHEEGLDAIRRRFQRIEQAVPRATS